MARIAEIKSVRRATKRGWVEETARVFGDVAVVKVLPDEDICDVLPGLKYQIVHVETGMGICAGNRSFRDIKTAAAVAEKISRSPLWKEIKKTSEESGKTNLKSGSKIARELGAIVIAALKDVA